jgi:sporulation protein YlmC with PRC-barrel domain
LWKSIFTVDAFVDVNMINIDEVLGKTVIGSAGNYIGEVNNIDIEPNTWHITHLHIKLSDKAAKELGLKKPLKSTNIRIQTELVKTLGVIITLNLSLIDLKNTLNYVS